MGRQSEGNPMTRQRKEDKVVEYNLNEIVRDMVYDCIKSLIPLIESEKVRFTPKDIAARYDVHKDTARHMMNRGDFGEVINFTERNKVVTLAGLLAYEEQHKGFVSGKPQPNQGTGRRKNRPEPGRI